MATYLSGSEADTRQRCDGLPSLQRRASAPRGAGGSDPGRRADVRGRLRGPLPRRRRSSVRITAMVSIGARLARLTFSPDILLTDGEAQLIADTPAIRRRCSGGWMPFGRVFETLAWGRRHVVMGANQIDRYGNQNLSAFGPLQHPPDRCSACAGALATPSTTPPVTGSAITQPGVRRRRRGVRYRLGQGRLRQPGLPVVNVYRVVSNLGVFDFGGPGRTMRAVSLHPGWTTTSGPTPPSMHGLDGIPERPAAHRRGARPDPHQSTRRGCATRR